MEQFQDNTKRTRRVEAVQTVLTHLTSHILREPIAASSDHYQVPEVAPTPAPIGWDSEGNYHDDNIRIEAPVQLNGQWDVA